MALENNTVVVIDTTNNTLIARVPVGRFPLGVAVTPNRRFVYVTNCGDASVAVISTATNSVVATVTVGTNPFDVGMARPCGCN